MTALEIAGSLSEAERRGLTVDWDDFCDGDRAQLPLNYPDALEQNGFVTLDAVDDDDLEDAFAWERGIEPGGSVYRLTPLGLEVRSLLKDNSDANG